MDPIAFRVKNDTQVDPEKPTRRFSQRQLVRCLTEGAERFGWSRRQAKPASVRDGRWLVGDGRRLRLPQPYEHDVGRACAAGWQGRGDGRDRHDRYRHRQLTIIAQTAGRMMGVPLEAVVVRLGNSAYPVSAGSGGQFGAANATAGVYAACVKLREQVAQRLGYNSADVAFAGGKVTSGNRSADLAQAASPANWSRRTRSSSAIWRSNGSSPPSARISSRSGSTPIRARRDCGGCWRCAPPAGSSIQVGAAR